VLIQVSESTQSRADFTRQFLRRTAMRDAVFLLTMLAAVVGIVAFALRPIARIAAHVRARPATDLTPLEPFDLPTDIQPLVHAVNQQIERSRAIAAQQRQFLDDASHQLRTPLTVLRVQVDYALRETDPLQMRDVLNDLSKELDKATRGCNQLLSLARSEMAQVKRERFDLSELTREAVLSVMPEARAKGQDLGCEETPAPALACGDRGLLREAISNLVENAVQYTPKGGEITVHAVSELDVAMVSVCDNGPGVTDEELGVLGKRFARGKNARASQGSGLGLAIARSIIERHGGSLRLQHGPGNRGLRAILSWPVA
jgi:two-component system sensor histidine kinase TctE